MSSVFLRYRDDDIYLHHLLEPTYPDNNTTGNLRKGFEMHAHEYFELLYLISGDCSFLVEGSEYPLHPGSIVIMRPAEVHSIQVSSKVDYERITLNFSSDIVKQFDPKEILLDAFTDRPLGAFNLYQQNEISSNVGRFLMNMVSTEKELSSYHRRLTILVNFMPLLGEIHEAYLRKMGSDDAGTFAFRNSELLEYINRNLSADLSLEAICDRFFISKSQLNRRFRQLTGTTVGEYVAAKRLLRAREMILAGMSSSQASNECGFLDYSTFFRAYKKKFGSAPTYSFAR